MRGNGIFNTVTQICATKVCCKLFLQGSLFVGRLCNKLPLRSYCDFTARFLSVENGNYILFSICLSFHATVFFCSRPHLFYWLFVLSRHDFLYLFKTVIIFRWLFVVSRHGVSFQNYNYILFGICLSFHCIFCLFNICAVQNNVKYNKYSLLMMNCQTKCNTQKKVVE